MDRKECKFDYSVLSDGSIKLGYTDSSFGKKSLDYDTTYLIINTKPMYVDGHTLYDCVVSWTNSNNHRENDYYNVIVEFDKELLFGDEKYYSYFMSKLLSKKRVLKYLKEGLNQNASIPCGIYVGSVDYNDDGVLERQFFHELGVKFHNEDYMVALREAIGKRTK